MKREKPKRPRTLRTIVLSLLRAETYDLGNGQRGSDVARNDSMMDPFFPKCKGALLFHTFARSSSLSILLHGLGQGMACVCMRLGRETGRERERESWGFVYDFARCSFDALFSPQICRFFVILMTTCVLPLL